MATIIVHGTFAVGKKWYWNSWGENGFCWALATAMEEVSGKHDVWKVNDRHVSHYPELRSIGAQPFALGREKPLHNGVYYWTGGNQTNERADAGERFARYLNVIRSLTDEPIRIVAHSHGCNVVKIASMHPVLDSRVEIDKAVFLACPHFWEPTKDQQHYFRYRANPNRFNRILNIYSTMDAVQLFFSELAENLGYGSLPHFWDTDLQVAGLRNLHNPARLQKFTERESAQVHWVDQDPLAQDLYHHYMVELEQGVVEEGKRRAIKAHSLLHGSYVGALAGCWLEASDWSVVQAHFPQGLGSLPAWDNGIGVS